MVNALGRGMTLLLSVLLSCWTAPVAEGSGGCVPGDVGVVTCKPSVVTSVPLVQSAFSLMVSPARLVIREDSVHTRQRILVVNNGQDPLNVDVTKESFTGGAKGVLVLRADAPYSATDWLTVSPTHFVLPPGAIQAVTAVIHAPAHPEPGDHQVAVEFLVPAGRNAHGVRINRGVASPVFITVPGRTSDTAVIRRLSAPGVMFGGSAQVTARIADIGTVHRDFRGRTRLAVSGGGRTDYFSDFTVLRGTTRDVTTTWTPPLLCICHLTVAFRNTKGAPQSASVRVIVFPLYQAIGLVGFLIIVLVALRWRQRRGRPRARHLAAPAGAGDA